MAWSSRPASTSTTPQTSTTASPTRLAQSARSHGSRPRGGGRSKTQLHKWCVCNQSKDTVNKESPTYPGHWVSTSGDPLQGNTHRNAGTDGSAFDKFKVDTAKAAPATGAKGKARAPAATSNSSSTVAEADLKRATAYIEQLKDQIKELGASRDAEHLKYAKTTELANTQVDLQAQKMNEMIGVNVKTLCSSQIEASKAIAKINEIRGHPEGFAENMLVKATEGLAPDLVKTWAAFSGVLTSETTEAADWGTARPKVQGIRSKNIIGITEFQGHESSSPPTPMQHTLHQLTDAKLLSQPMPDGYQALVPPAAVLLPWATGVSAPGKKRKHVDGDDSDAASSDKGEDEDDDDDDDGESS